MGLREAFRALWTPATALDLEVEVADTYVTSTARDIDPNELSGGGGRVSGASYYEAASAVMNRATGQGTGADPSEFTRWAVPRYLMWRERFGMGRNALIQQALGKLPNTATGKGWRVRITDPDVAVDDRQEVSDKITAYEKRLQLPQRVNRALIRARQHSQALVVLGVDDGRSFDQPVDREAIRTIRWAVTIDSRDFTPHKLAPPTSEYYGNIEVYQITDVNGILEDGLRYGEKSISYTNTEWDTLLEAQRSNASQMLVHADRVLSFATPDYFSLLDSLQDSLGAFFETMGGIRTAARESSMIKYKISELKRKMWSKNHNIAREHMNMVQRAKSAINAFVVDSDEDVSILSRPLAGVGDLANPVMAWVSAALAIPVTEFWKVSPGGFGKGEAERETFHEDTQTYQEQQITPELSKAHGYILAAHDGAQLPFETQREIEYNDLTPPDEVQNSKLRTEAINTLRALGDAGYISRPELRKALEGLNDEYFRLELDQEFVDRPNPAQVGIFTGSLEALKQVYGEGQIPIDAVRQLLLALDPVHYNLDNIFKIVPAVEDSATVATPSPTSNVPGAAPGPGDEEDETHEPSDVELKWAEVEPPSGARTAKELAQLPELEADNVRSLHIKRLAREGLITAYRPRGFSKEPLFVLEEVQRGLLQRQGHLEATQDASPRALFISVHLPPSLARWVPYKEQDSSPPHVTLAYVKDVPGEIIQDVLDELRQTFESLDPFKMQVHGKPVHYFETKYHGTDNGRVAYALAEFMHAQETFDDLIDALGSFGLTVEYAGQYHPHVTLAYLAEDEHYDGPAPDGRWTAASVAVSYAGEIIENMTLDGRLVTDDGDVMPSTTVHDAVPDEEQIKLWLAEHVSDARKMPRDRMLKLKQLEDDYTYLRPPNVTTVYRGLRNVKRSKVGQLVGLSDAVVDKSWTTDKQIAAKFASTEWTTEEPDESRVGVVLVADAESSKLLLNYEKLAELPGVADRWHDRWKQSLRQAILDEKEVLALSPLNIRSAKFVSMSTLPGAGETVLTTDISALHDLITTSDRGPLIKEGYIWRTQKDSKVRPAHEKLEGRRFRTNEGHPTEGQPGDAPNCRCAKEIIVPPKGTKRAKAAAKRTTRRALRRNFKRISGKADK